MMDNLCSTLLLLSIATVLGSECTSRMEGGDTVDLLNRLMRTDNPWQGLLLHVPDYVDSSSGYLPMSHYNQHFKASNPSYPLTYAYEYDNPTLTDNISKAFPGFVSMDAPNCPAVGPTECSNGKGGDNFVKDCAGTSPQQWGYAYVTEVYGTRYAANEGLPDYKESKAKGKVCYPTDANAIDQRDSSGNGACKDGSNQDLVCNGDKSVCLSKRSNKCKCEYDDIPGEGDGVGQWIVNHGEGTCGKISDGDLQAAYYVDAAACWTDVNDDDGMKNMVKHSNSLWDYRNEWLDNVLPEKQGKYGELTYWGWTECTIKVEDYDTNPKEYSDALAIIMPVQEHKDGGWEGDNWGGGSWGNTAGSLCDLSLAAQIRLETTLHAMWTQGYGSKAVVVMEQTRGLDSTDCNKYWSGQNCEDGYKKHFFRQSFLFPGGSCLLLYPDGEVYYSRDEPLNDKFPCRENWPNGYDFSNSGHGGGGWWKAAKAHKTGKLSKNSAWNQELKNDWTSTKPKSAKKSSNWHASGWEEEEKHSWHSVDNGENDNWNHSDDSSWHEEPSWDEEWKTKSSKKSWNHWASEDSWDDDSKSSKDTEWGRSGDWQDWSSGSWVNEKYQWKKDGHM